MLTCDLIKEADGLAWQEFVSTHPQCGLYHHLGWKHVIETAYGHLALYLMTKKNGKVTGVLPLVLIRSRIFGTSLSSLPFLDFSGIAADDETSQLALLEKAQELGRKFSVDYIELRQIEPISGDFQTFTEKVRMTLDLESDEDKVFAKLSSERRNRVRRALKSGLTVDVDGPAELSIFYDIWTRNMRDLGSPPHSQKFFEQILENFEGQCSLLLVRQGKEYIGAALALFWKDTLAVPWVSSLREYRNVYPNNILYWEAIRLAIKRGLQVFDFGRSSHGSGTFQFKKRWGAVATPLHWQFVPVRSRKPIPITKEDKFRLAVDIWKRIPVPITRLIGPALRKNITA